MKSFFIIICSLFLWQANAQDKKVYVFYVHLDDYTTAPKFEKEGSTYKYVGLNTSEKTFFSKYVILEFKQAYPDSRRLVNLNIYLVATYDKVLMTDMVSVFPNRYLKFHDITDNKIVYDETYPNDYGNGSNYTNPVPNLGFPVNLKNLDYIHAPKAWDYTYGNNSILIGISDGGVDTTDVEFKHKMTFIPGFIPGQYITAGDGAAHGTSVTAIAAAQGNNGNGITGVCSDCGIVEAVSEYGGSNLIDVLENYPDLNRLLLLAKAGVKVINMSWSLSSDGGFQTIIDELHDCYNVVLVATSGNSNPNNPNYFKYPSSYNHVISVTSVNHKNNGWNDEVIYNFNNSGVDVHRYIADQIAPSIVINPDGSLITYASLTMNSAVDICAPGFATFSYATYVLGGLNYYVEGATSPAAPHVSGTVGLMYSANEYLINDEVEDIIQLTAKNLEVIHGNEPYVGRIGAGKLETGDAVEFVYEMKEVNGNARIDGQDFYRFDFNLSHINNKLTISNQTFRDKCTADFTAKKIIDVLPGSDFKPGTEGFVDLKINAALTAFPIFEIPEDCDNYVNARKGVFTGENQTNAPAVKLYPNPNNGSFEVTLSSAVTSDAAVQVIDIYGKVVYNTTVKTATFAVDIPNLSTGVYFVKISNAILNETIKFIKQ